MGSVDQSIEVKTCPNCKPRIIMIRVPSVRTVSEPFGGEYSTFSYECLHCGYKADKFKISSRYLQEQEMRKYESITNLTPRKDGFFQKLFSIN